MTEVLPPRCTECRFHEQLTPMGNHWCLATPDVPSLCNLERMPYRHVPRCGAEGRFFEPSVPQHEVAAA